MAALAMLGAMTVSCSSDNDELLSEQPVNKDNVVTMTLTVNMDEAGTRALTEGGVKTFAAGDKIAVIYKRSGSGTVQVESEALTADAGNSATFTVTLTNPTASSKFRIVYPAAMAEIGGNGADPNNDNATLNFTKLCSQQDGTLATLGSTFDVATYDGTLTSSATLPSGTFSLTNKLSIAKFKISDGTDDITGNITKLNIVAGSDAYNVTTTTGKTYIYVAMKPYTGALTINANTSDKSYYKSVASGTLTLSHITPINLTVAEKTAQDGVALASVNDDAYLGWVVWSNGKAYDPAKAMPTTGSAQGMIGYVGSASSCTHGLAIALEDVSSNLLSWNNTGTNNNSMTASAWCSEWNTSHSVTGITESPSATAGWRLPSPTDFGSMFQACGGDAATVPTSEGTWTNCNYGTFCTKLLNAGGANMTQYYWTSQQTNWSTIMYYYYSFESKWFFSNTHETPRFVRAVLAF